MLWHKAWLETRFRLLFTLFFMCLILTFQHGAATTPPGVHGIVRFSNPILVVMACSMLAGAGIATQPTLAVSKGTHGSTLFTLSLPVSRLRLLGVRAGIGWLEGAGVLGMYCCAFWFLSPTLRGIVTPADMFRYAVTLAGCASAIYCLSVLLATLLDDQWRVWGTMIGSGVYWWVSTHIPFPAFANIFRGMGEDSPLIAHTMPWNVIAFSAGLGIILFFTALKIAKAREY
ncbi:MAG TPA: hypothetical protein VMB49_22270 [Acidobacteriaceae bacterium]|nr:hypothetical protein [Acidobacteriaceae bacterium]